MHRIKKVEELSNDLRELKRKLRTIQLELSRAEKMQKEAFDELELIVQILDLVYGHEKTSG